MRVSKDLDKKMSETCNNLIKSLGIRIQGEKGERGSVEGVRIIAVAGTWIGDNNAVFDSPKAISGPSPSGFRGGGLLPPSSKEGYNGISGLCLWLG
jgi:hypothetical protein